MKTLYVIYLNCLLNTCKFKEAPLYSYKQNDDLDYYIYNCIALNQNEYEQMIDSLLKHNFYEDIKYGLRYEIRYGE